MTSPTDLGAWLRQQCFIDGTWCHADAGETIDVYDPGNGELLGTVPKMTVTTANFSTFTNFSVPG